VNAGSGYSAVNALQASPVGVTITSHTSTACTTTGVYANACFDSLTIITADGSMPPLTPSTDNPSVAKAVPQTPFDTNSGGTMFLSTPVDPANGAGSYGTWAAQFRANDEIMLVQGGTDFANGQPSMSVLSVKTAVAAGNYIQLTFNAGTTSLPGCPVTDSAGVVTVKTVQGVPVAKDTLGLYDPSIKDATYGVPLECARFTNSFKPELDYVIRLTPTTYHVDTTTDPANPTLIRTFFAPQPSPAAPVQVDDKIAEQIVGFNVDAWSSKPKAYSTLSNSDLYNRDWASIRALKIQLMARATPNSDHTVAFKNNYDGGNYQVQGVSVVINPRNLNTN
jgi:hypothetical protein